MCAPSSAEADQEAKRVEQLATQFQVWKTVTQRVLEFVGWADASATKAVHDACADFPEKAKVLEAAGHLLSCMVLATAVLKCHGDAASEGQGVHAALKYVVGTLQVKEDDLPRVLREKVHAAISGKSSPAEEAGGVGARPQQAATATGRVSVGSRALKKLRK